MLAHARFGPRVCGFATGVLGGFGLRTLVACGIVWVFKATTLAGPGSCLWLFSYPGSHGRRLGKCRHPGLRMGLTLV